MRTEADLEAIPPGSLDYVYSLNVLEHIDDDAGALQAIRARLAPGGQLFLYVPAFMVLYTALDRRVGHFRRYRRSGLRRLLANTGFVVDEARYADSLGFGITLAYKAIGRSDGRIDPRALRIYDGVVFPVSKRLDPMLGRVAGKNLLVRAHVAA